MSTALLEPVTAVPASEITKELYRRREYTIRRYVAKDLLTWFQELCILVYRAETVEQHKQHMKAALERRRRTQVSVTGVTALLLIACSAILSENHIIAPGSPIAFGFIAVIAILCGLAFCGGWQLYWGIEWVSYSYADYAKQATIPQVVEEQAERLRRYPYPRPLELRISRLAADPVLEVWDGSVCYVTAIWEKPGIDEPLLGQ